MKKEIGLLNFNQKHWLMSKGIDLLILFVPLWLLWILIGIYSEELNHTELPTWAWLIFILGIDVSHVWSTMFRSYLSKKEFKHNKRLFILAPIFAFIISILILANSIHLFWRIMAYFAVFHFIKQQYGFVALYKLKSGDKRKQWLSDKLIIYIATIYPIIYWHFNSQSSFNWFAQNDFIQLHVYFNSAIPWSLIFTILNIAYWTIIGVWLSLEIKDYIEKKQVSIPKLLWVLTTTVNWWFAIVYFNSDFIFSITNVVAHGLPYLALIYFYQIKKNELISGNTTKFPKKIKWLVILILTVLICALTEEYLWDMFINRENQSIFNSILPYHWEQLNTKWPIIITIACLALPQQVHYILDGFIWKSNKTKNHISHIFKNES